MKKKVLTILLAMSMATSLMACGTKEAEQETQEDTAVESDTEELTDLSTVSTKNINVDDYVTIGDYSGLEVAVDIYNFSDEDVEQEMQTEFESYVEYMDAYDYSATEKDSVESGDIVNLNYCGKKDGEAFDGGTAEGAHLEIGSNSFIPGFEDGLIGHAVGEEFDLPLTFPEGYQNAELAGKDVVFEIKINSIDEKKMPEMTDDMIAGMGMEFQTVDAYREGTKEYLQSACDEQNQSGKESAVWSAVYEVCEVKDAPQELVDDAKSRIVANTESYAEYYQMDVEEFIQQNLGITKEEYDQQVEEAAQATAKEKLAVAAVAKQAGIELTDEDVRAYAESEYETYGYESVEAMYADVGSGPYYDYVLTEKLNEYLIGAVKVTENEPVSIMQMING